MMKSLMNHSSSNKGNDPAEASPVETGVDPSDAEDGFCKEDDFLREVRVAILGLGLMGGSLALALRGRCAHLSGSDPDPGVVSLARQKHVVDQASLDPAEILPDADLVILAAPVRAILALLDELPRLHSGRAVVLDLGSTKAQIVSAMQQLPERFDPLGGHPMCGKELSSLVHAEATLYQGAPFAFTPLPRTSSRAREMANQLAYAVGAHPLWLDPSTHDVWTAATSHLPYLLANILAAATPVVAAPLAGPGFRSTTRLAASSIQMMMDTLLTNRENVLQATRRFRRQLDAVETCLAEGDEAALREMLERGLHNYQTLSRKSEN